MFDTLKVYNQLKERLDPDAALKIAEVIGAVYGELSSTVTKEEFNDLKETVRELAEAQKQTQQTVNELAEAQKRTEQRLEQLTLRVDELAEAQKRTEQRLEQLTLRVNELAEAQKRTEDGLQRLTEEVRQLNAGLKETRRQIGGMAMNWGYSLENESYKALPRLLLRDYGIVIERDLDRDYIADRQGKEIEINIIGKGKQNGTELLIVGESKSQLSKNDIDQFIRRKLKRLEGIHPKLFPVLVTHMVSSSAVEQYAREKGIALYKSSKF